MDLFSFLLAFVPATLGLVVSVIHACIKFREAKKDDVWETVTRIICAAGVDPVNAADDFIELYEALNAYRLKRFLKGAGNRNGRL